MFSLNEFYEDGERKPRLRHFEPGALFLAAPCGEGGQRLLESERISAEAGRRKKAHQRSSGTNQVWLPKGAMTDSTPSPTTHR